MLARQWKNPVKTPKISLPVSGKWHTNVQENHFTKEITLISQKFVSHFCSANFSRFPQAVGLFEQYNDCMRAHTAHTLTSKERGNLLQIFSLNGMFDFSWKICCKEDVCYHSGNVDSAGKKHYSHRALAFVFAVEMPNLLKKNFIEQKTKSCT